MRLCHRTYHFETNITRRCDLDLGMTTSLQENRWLVLSQRFFF